MAILYCFPIGVAFVSYFRGESKIVLVQWLSMVGLIIGLYLMLSTGEQVLNLYGLFISFLGLLFFIAFVVTASNLSAQIGATTFNFYVSILGIVLLTIGFILLFGLTFFKPSATIISPIFKPEIIFFDKPKLILFFRLGLRYIYHLQK